MHADIDTVKVVVKNVPDYAAGKEKNDLGFLTFDLQVTMQESILNPMQYFTWCAQAHFLGITPFHGFNSRTNVQE